MRYKNCNSIYAVIIEQSRFVRAKPIQYTSSGKCAASVSRLFCDEFAFAKWRVMLPVNGWNFDMLLELLLWLTIEWKDAKAYRKSWRAAATTTLGLVLVFFFFFFRALSWDVTKSWCCFIRKFNVVFIIEGLRCHRVGNHHHMTACCDLAALMH